MKTLRFVPLALAIGLTTVAGCKKSDAPGSAPGTATQINGVNVDLPKLDVEFASAAPELQEGVNLLRRAFRYAQFPQALMELEKLSTNPGLSESQKKLVADLLEQTKQVIAKSPPPPGQ